MHSKFLFYLSLLLFSFANMFGQQPPAVVTGVPMDVSGVPVSGFPIAIGTSIPALINTKISPNVVSGVNIAYNGNFNYEFDCEPIMEMPEQKDDPGYSVYKKGYDMILDEEWDSAIEKFSELLKKHSGSQYADDAMYWRAYAYKQTDNDKARKEYKEFIKKYPKSKYYDDAVADLNDLDDSVVFVTSGDSIHAVLTPKPRGYAYSIGTTYSRGQQQLRSAQDQLRGHLSAVGTPTAYSIAGNLFTPMEKLDKETQLKMDALYALGDKKEDDMSFNALKDVAVDPGQHRQLRVAAMDMMVNLKKHDPLPVFLEIAKKDTSERIQNLSIDYIGMLSNNKNRTIETLTELYNAIPKYRLNQLQTVLGSIAEIGNDKAVDFLAKIAADDDNYDIRRNAIFYLGNIGNDKAREALIKVFKSKKDR